MAGMVMAEVRRSLAERGLRVTEQDLVNRALLWRAIIHDGGDELALLPATAKYDLAYVEYSDRMKRLLRDYVAEASVRPVSAARPLVVRSEPLSRAAVLEVSKDVASDLVIRGRVVSLGRPVVDQIDYEHSILPRFIRNRDGVVLRAAYEEDLVPALPDDLELVNRTTLGASSALEYWALQVRLFAQEPKDGRIVWSGAASMTFPTIFDSEVDLRAKKERLKRAIATEVELLIGDLFGPPQPEWPACYREVAVVERPEIIEEAAPPERELEKEVPAPREVVISEELLEELPPVAPREKEFLEISPLEDVHFDYDRATISPAAAEIMARNAAWLTEHPGVEVLIEGHCDERGTLEYNLALGERRAVNVRKFLVRLGIGPDRLFTISYGEERPLDARHNEEAWAKNRRAHFLITSEEKY